MQILGMAIRNVHSWEAAVDVLANDRLAPVPAVRYLTGRSNDWMKKTCAKRAMLVDRRAPQTGRDATSVSSRRPGRTSRSRDLSRLHETVGEAIGLTLDRGIEHLYRVWIVLVCEYGALRVH